MLGDHPMIRDIERNGYPTDKRQIFCHCEECQEPIYEGMEYIEDNITGDILCLECFRERFSKRTA